MLKIREYEDKLFDRQQGVQVCNFEANIPRPSCPAALQCCKACTTISPFVLPKSCQVGPFVVQEQNKLNAAASWQVKTDQKIKALNINTRFEALKIRRQADIERRQAQLAEKLAAEEQALQQELLSSRTTPEQRRAELTARARSSAARREAERQQLAQQLYEQQFRESCDLLRGKESQIATHEIQHAQQQQVSTCKDKHCVTANGCHEVLSSCTWQASAVIFMQVIEKEQIKQKQWAEDMYWSQLNDQDRLAKDQKYVVSASCKASLQCVCACISHLGRQNGSALHYFPVPGFSMSCTSTCMFNKLPHFSRLTATVAHVGDAHAQLWQLSSAHFSHTALGSLTRPQLQSCSQGQCFLSGMRMTSRKPGSSLS